MKEKKERSSKEQLYITLLLLLIALVAVTAATAAWFTIADRTKVSSMDMNVTSGISLRFDLDPHPSFDEYVRTLSFADIAGRIKEEKGFDMQSTPLVPVTTSDCSRFTYQDGKVSDSKKGEYLEFTLNFMATEDMVVHLTSSDSANGGKGTLISSKNAKLPEAMRISFTIGEETFVYDPGMEAKSEKKGKITYFGLPGKEDMVYTDDNALFFIRKNENVPVIVHIWMEGTDPVCTDALRGTDYSIALRFEGTGRNNEMLVEEHAD